MYGFRWRRCAIVFCDIIKHVSVVIVQVLPVTDEVIAESLRAKPPLPVVCPVVSIDPPQGTFYEPATISIPYLVKDRVAPTVHLMAGTVGRPMYSLMCIIAYAYRTLSLKNSIEISSHL